MRKKSLAALPHTEVIGLVIFGLVIVAFMVSAWLSWWKERTWSKQYGRTSKRLNQ